MENTTSKEVKNDKSEVHRSDALFSLGVDIVMQTQVLPDGTVVVMNERKTKLVH